MRGKISQLFGCRLKIRGSIVIGQIRYRLLTKNLSHMKRIVHEWEWQYAAQGGDSKKIYPWGNDWDSSCVPTPGAHSFLLMTPRYRRNMTPPADVTSHPCGASSFGVEDLIGNVYQWTEEFRDDHTRTAIIRGGNHYQPQGSKWYLPQNYHLQEHQRFILMAPSLDRSAGIGFRCAQDSI